MKRHGEEVWKSDLAWCREQGLDYLPVAVPGFSWFNMKGKAFDKDPAAQGQILLVTVCRGEAGGRGDA